MHYIKVATNLSQTLDAYGLDKARRDDYAKCVLADPQIMSFLLQHAIPELATVSRQEIMQGLCETVVCLTVPEMLHLKLESLNTETLEDNGKKIVYDVRSTVCIRGVYRKFLLNIEAQNSTLCSKLGYHIENRITYYMSRMISAQKNVEFTHSHYDDIKPVHSIWICMDAHLHNDSIADVALACTSRFGKPVRTFNFDLLHGTIIHLRQSTSAETSKNELIAMLELLFSKQPILIKKQLLEEKFDLKMNTVLERSLTEMCNVSEYYEDLIRNEGINLGIEQGETLSLISLILKKVNRGKDISSTAAELETAVETIRPIYTLAQTSPQADARQIYAQLQAQ